MPVAEITRKFEFDAGHRVLGHEGMCKNLHGHRYVAEVTVVAEGLDWIGRVIDFGEVKRLVGEWINENWDHNFLIHPEDPLAVLREMRAVGEYQGPDVFNGKRPFIFPTGTNPTAENIAEYLYHQCFDLLPENIKVTEVVIWETPNCKATYPRRSR